ncbi:SPFH domain-containing protein [Vitreoscilla massiliensis]|uniref:SPFH domain-containing protein n=2 Tax=Vitreoscilla massiliensis TaxID=1689272 RepID=A0ABY4ECZ7_9NEIS|nr:SPFH domain-containing protein [Vitreoscilla massiliensis]UOO91302.1 SPFH domain-containing protein [Vitreoscilla massiliensis]
MENYGRNGKADFSVVSGRVWVIAPGTELYQVPLWEQRQNFESAVKLKAADNTEFTAKPTYSFNVIKERSIDVVFNNKQLGGGEAFITSLGDNVLEPKILDIMKEASRSQTTDELMQKGGSLAFEKRVQDLVAKEFETRGLKLMTFSSQLEFSKSVSERIDKRNEVNTNLAVLDQQIEEQKKRLELSKLEAETNKARSDGLTDKLLTQQFIEKWDGKTPLYGETPVTIFKQQ